MELYYYTSTDTMRYVLTGGDIYATNIRYMNDSQEYINGLEELQNLSKNEDLVKEWIKQRQLDKGLWNEIQDVFASPRPKEHKHEMEYYSISFCKRNDLLSQWVIYARESGVSIKMNFEEPVYKFFTDSVDEEGVENKKKAEWKLLPREVYYFTYNAMSSQGLEDQYKDVAYNILDQLYVTKSSEDPEEFKNEVWRYTSAFVKRYDFYQEEEYRLVFEPGASAYLPKIQYRSDKNVLKPYLDIKCEKGWPIWEIMVGPGFNQQVVFDSVKHILNHAKVKIGLKSPEDYVKRVKEYLKPYIRELNQCNEYRELRDWFEQIDWTSREYSEEDVVFFCNQKLKEIVNIVINDLTYKNAKQYFEDHHFTRSGVVLTKSSIPYIF